MARRTARKNAATRNGKKAQPAQEPTKKLKPDRPRYRENEFTFHDPHTHLADFVRHADIDGFDPTV